MKKNILVTGGAGFIGSHLVDLLINKKHNVIIVDNLITGKLENINNEAKFYKMDILSSDIEQIFQKEKIDIVIHLAAQISVSEASKNVKYDAIQNIIGTINILEFCKKFNINKIIASSSAAVYGEPKYLPIDEIHPTCPISQYGLSKLTMEQYIQMSGLEYIICRFSNVYGERQTLDGEAGVVTIFDNKVKNNKPVSIFGNGEQIRDFIYVKDIAKIIYKLIENNVTNEILNISSNTGTTINQLLDCIKFKYNSNIVPKYLSKRDGDIDKSILSNEKLLLHIKSYEFKNLNKNGEQKCIKYQY